MLTRLAMSLVDTVGEIWASWWAASFFCSWARWRPPCLIGFRSHSPLIIPDVDNPGHCHIDTFPNFSHWFHWMLHFTWDQDFPMSLVCAGASSDVKRANGAGEKCQRKKTAVAPEGFLVSSAYVNGVIVSWQWVRLGIKSVYTSIQGLTHKKHAIKTTFLDVLWFPAEMIKGTKVKRYGTL